MPAINEDGNYIDIGTTTTDGYYGTFSVAWTPEAEGTYKIIASFVGDESYGSSGASTAVTVGASGASVETPQIPETPLASDYIMAIVAAAIAVIIAVAIVHALLYLKK